MVPGVCSRPVDMCAVSQQLRSLSPAGWLQEDGGENSSRSFRMMLGLSASFVSVLIRILIESLE